MLMHSKPLLSILASMALAACAGKSSPSSTPIPPTAAPATALELGEITLFEGANAMLKIHANGTTELGGRSGRIDLKPGVTASSDSLPITWKAGPTLRADGTLEAEGAAVAKLNADGTIVELKTNKTLPLTVTADKVTFTVDANTVAVELAADGKLSRVGAPAEPADKQIRVEGADTAGKRRSALVMLAVMLAPGKVSTQSSSASVPAVPVEPIKN